MSRELLEQLWHEHHPPIDDIDLKIDLVQYDAELAGLISHVVGRSRELPFPITLDHHLATRVRGTGSQEATDYLDRLESVATLARDVHEDET